MSGRLSWARRAAPGQPTLLCLPFAGGDASAFRGWQAALRTGCAVACANLPGRGAHFTAAPLRSVAEQAAWLLDEVRAIAPPLAIYGHSMGALTGYELAHALQARGAAPALLMAAAHHAPGRAARAATVHDLPEAELLQHVAGIDGTPAEVLAHPELVQLLAPRLRADFAACETYRPPPRPPLDIPLVAYGGADDGDVPVSALLQWAAATARRFDCVLLPGAHFFLRSAGDLLLRDIDSRLARITADLSRHGGAANAREQP